MLILPTANPLYEHIDARKANLPDVLDKLGKGGFSGYVSYVSGTAAGGFCVFAKGKLICVIFSVNERDRNGFEAISALFDSVLANGGELNVYRMTADLAVCAYALALGTRLYSGEEVRQVDMKSILARIKNQGLNGVVRFSTAERYAFIFYMNGQPVGFYHDGATAIETSSDESRKIAALPGARLDVFSAKPLDELMHSDLLQMVNLGKLWEAANSRQAARGVQATAAASVPPKPASYTSEHLAELIEDLREIATAYLSRDGRPLVDRLLKEGGGNELFSNPGRVQVFLEALDREAQIIDSHARIEEMVDLMRSEIAGRLAVSLP